MSSWSDGYITDVEYTSNFFRELAPGFLSFACLNQGVHPPNSGSGAAYLELGCGQGFNTNLLAAANPSMRFVGVDFMPGHIVNARRWAEEAELDNVTFEDLSFEQMLDLPEGRLPRFDFIVLHGVYSWISRANRAAIVRLVDRYLKPGGLFYVSYNCLPGWAALAPLQRFIHDHARHHQAPRLRQAVDGVKAAQQMLGQGAAYFKHVAQIEQHLKLNERQSPHYLAHEYLNDCWDAMYHADVARDLEAARVEYVGSATLSDNVPELSAPPGMIKDIRAAADPVWRETLLDYSAIKTFRRDLFQRGVTGLSPLEMDAALREVRLALTLAPQEVKMRFRTALGEGNADEARYGPLIAACEDGPRPVADLAALPGVASTPGLIKEALALLCGAHYLAPVTEADPGPAQRFNRVIVRRAQLRTPAGYLASPVIGSGVAATFIDLLGLAAVFDGAGDAKAASPKLRAMMKQTGRKLVKTATKGGEPVEEDPSGVEEALERFFDTRLAVYRELKVL